MSKKNKKQQKLHKKVETVQKNQTTIEKPAKASKKPHKYPRTVPRGQHPKPAPEKKPQQEIPLPHNKTNVPTGKVKSIKDAKKRREEREQQYRTFRMTSLVRRAQRLHIPEEEIERLKGLLDEQLKTPKQYHILIMLGNAEKEMFKASLENAKIQYKILTDDFAWLDGDQDVLAKIREIAPPYSKVHPYVKKLESLLPKRFPDVKKPSNNSEEVAAKAKAERKETNKVREQKKSAKAILRLERLRTLRNVLAVHKKPSGSFKKASKSVKKAA